MSLFLALLLPQSLLPIPTGSLATLAQDLARARVSAGGSYQRYLRDATHLVKQCVDDKPWNSTVKQLNAGGFAGELPLGAEQVEFKCPAGTNFKLPSGEVLRLRINVERLAVVSRTAPTSFKTRVIWPRLVYEPKRPFGEVKKLIPPGTVLGDYLGSKGLISLAKRYPTVESIDICYIRLYMTSVPMEDCFVAPSFHVSSTLGKSQDGGDYAILSSSMFESNLDPRENPRGKRSPRPFSASDTYTPPPQDASPSVGFQSWDSSNRVIYRDPGLVTYPDPPEVVEAHSIADLRAFPVSTRRLNLVGYEWWPGDLNELRRFRGLEELGLYNQIAPNKPASPGEMLPVLDLPKLRVLWLPWRGVESGFIGKLSKLTSLERLTIPTDGIKESDILRVMSLPRLKVLWLNGESGVSDRIVRRVATVRTLEELEITLAPETSPRATDELGGLPKLKSLLIAALKYRAGLDDLLSRVPRLESLTLKEFKLSSSDVRAIGQMTRLNWLRLDNCSGLTNENILPLRNLSRVDYIDLGESQAITRVGVQRLVKSMKGPYKT